MAKPLYLSVLCIFLFQIANAQKNSRWIDGMYLQWGYNVEWYTPSNIRFKMSNGDDFTLHKAKAHNNPGFQTIIDKPLQISIPQYNYRVGFYINKKNTRAIEINFDHTKYIVNQKQKVHVTGKIDGIPVDGDSILNANT